jgi:hypothetical protein
MMNKPDTNQLISELAGSLAPVSPLKAPALQLVPWVISALIYSALVAFVLEPRFDLPAKLASPDYIFELIFIAALSLSAALSSLFLKIPDLKGRLFILAVPLTLFTSFMIYMGLNIVSAGIKPGDVHFHRCITDAIIIGAVPAALLFFSCIKGCTVRPLMMGFMNVLAIGALAWGVLRITCPADNVEHLFLFHFLPYFSIGCLLAFVSRYIYRW